MTRSSEIVLHGGDVIDVPLNRLKASERNARKTPHGEAAIAALAASIAAKGVLQAPVVEPEVGPDGQPTGAYLVTIGEGRRQALRLLAGRKQIARTALVRCVLDVAHDPHEISLDENVTRTDMHPADQFEAFRRLAEARGFGAEEIAARFGVSAQVVRQRLRLGAVSPTLLAVYREGGLVLDQLMAFAVSEDHARQEQVFEQLSYNRSPSAIRRAMTEAKIDARDWRAQFVGAEAYGGAGGSILRDLFTEDGGGWFEDVGLVERLCAEKLEALAREVQAREGWKWAEGHLDYPHAHGLRRVYPSPVARSEADEAAMAALGDEAEALSAAWEAEDPPPEIAARLAEIEAALAAFGEDYAHAPEDLAVAGVFVVLGHDGRARIERGFVRAEDEPVEEADGSPDEADEEAPGAGIAPVTTAEATDTEEGAGLSEKLVLDLTAHRTLGLRDALASQPTLALTALVHALAIRAFYPPWEQGSCLEIRTASTDLETHAPGLAETEAGRRLAERHAAWARRLPREAGDAWAVVAALDGAELMDLLAHCAALTLNAVHGASVGEGRRGHGDQLAKTAGLDMTAHWRPTVASYLGRVTKAAICEAVSEAVSQEAATRIGGLKKAEMAEAAEALLAGTGWLPDLLRTRGADTDGEAGIGDDEPGRIAAE